MSQYAPFKARLVMGSPFDLSTTDHEGKPEANENKHNWFMGFAVPKGPEWDAIYGSMYAEAVNDSRCTAALCGQPGFNWKIEDCDAPSDPSKLGTASRPAGHMLIKFTRYKAMGACGVYDGNHQLIVNDKAVKRGDYFYIAASTKFNGAATVRTNAGMYQNIEGLMFAEAGAEIISEGAFSASTGFAGLTGGAVINGATPQANTPVAAAAPVTTPPPATPVVTPATDLVQPQVPGAAVTPPPPPVAAVTPPPPPVVVEARYEYGGFTKTEAEWEATPGWVNGLIKVHGKLVA